MKLSKTINSVKKIMYLIISEEELDELLSTSELLVEENTYMSDKIRLLKYRDQLILQEKTTKDEYIIRSMNTKEDAEKFINERLEVYNRMWDGCGCKVEYYS
jgi:uncharacterized lipoprotein YehR (DUF1307 family)